MGSEQIRFLHHQEQSPARPKRWGGCWGGLSCFGTQKGRKRVAPASRVPEAHVLVNQPNGPQVVGLANHQNITVAPSLLAPPSSPASFTNSALPSTVQSPSCFLSSNSPRGPSSTMFATGPYAHEPQLVSPPVFSTFTTEPSTAPLTPPPELAHLTTPSSPDVPFARFLSSSLNLRRTSDKTNDLQATYSLYPGSPASNLRSPISRTPTLDTGSGTKVSQDSNFFCPDTFAQFYLDQSSFPHTCGRISVSKESDVYNNGGNGQQSRQTKTCKQDVEEIEAYRASFGFSADEIVTTAHYVEISDVADDSFSMIPFSSNKLYTEEPASTTALTKEKPKPGDSAKSSETCNSGGDHSYKRVHCELLSSWGGFKGDRSLGQAADSRGQSTNCGHSLADSEDIFSRMETSRLSRKRVGLSSSDAEIDTRVRRGRSLREGRRGGSIWDD